MWKDNFVFFQPLVTEDRRIVVFAPISAQTDGPFYFGPRREIVSAGCEHRAAGTTHLYPCFFKQLPTEQEGDFIFDQADNVVMRLFNEIGNPRGSDSS